MANTAPLIVFYLRRYLGSLYFAARTVVIGTPRGPRPEHRLYRAYRTRPQPCWPLECQIFQPLVRPQHWLKVQTTYFALGNFFAKLPVACAPIPP